MSKEQGKETLVDRVFKAHPKADKVFTTSDGQPFTVEHHAKMHAKNLKNGTITTHTRKKGKASSNIDKNGNGKLEAQELIAAIEKAKTVAEVDALIPEGEKRTTVLKAADDQKAKLSEGGE